MAPAFNELDDSVLAMFEMIFIGKKMRSWVGKDRAL